MLEFWIHEEEKINAPGLDPLFHSNLVRVDLHVYEDHAMAVNLEISSLTQAMSNVVEFDENMLSHLSSIFSLDTLFLLISAY
jgi:hypothetical protein